MESDILAASIARSLLHCFPATGAVLYCGKNSESLRAVPVCLVFLLFFFQEGKNFLSVSNIGIFETKPVYLKTIMKECCGKNICIMFALLCSAKAIASVQMCFGMPNDCICLVFLLLMGVVK